MSALGLPDADRLAIYFIRKPGETLPENRAAAFADAVADAERLTKALSETEAEARSRLEDLGRIIRKSRGGYKLPPHRPETKESSEGLRVRMYRRTLSQSDEKVASPPPSSKDTMTTPSREEIEARLAAADARADAKFLGFEKTIGDALHGIRADLQNSRHSTETTASETLRLLTAMQGEIKLLHNDVAHAGKLRSAIWGSAAVIIATIVATVALAFTAFDSGRDTAALKAPPTSPPAIEQERSPSRIQS